MNEGEGKWIHWDLNQRFLVQLYEKEGNKPFDLKTAYLVYFKGMKPAAQAYHLRAYEEWHGRRYSSIDEYITESVYASFTQMNARNTLSAAAHRGVLERVGRGIYRFPQNTRDDLIKDIKLHKKG